MHHQENQEDHRREQVGQKLFAMAEIMLEVIALGLERIVVLVLNFPSCAACGGEARNVFRRDEMGRCPHIVEQYGTVLSRSDEFELV